jgi:ABC-2 type transport system ATP-binding protein
MECMITFDRVGKSYGAGRLGDRAPRAVHALRDVTLAFEPGAVHAIVGPNGAGKTTLLGLLLGFLRPTAGDVLIEDDDPAVYVRRAGAGYLPERFALPEQWPVRSALAALARLDGADAAGVVERALDRYDLAPVADRELGMLSRGTLQRVGLAQAFLPERPLIVLDEPTEGLDPVWRIRFRDGVVAARERGATVILASHDLAEVERLADRAILLEDGRVRDVLETRGSDDDGRAYTLRLVEPSDAVALLFPGAAPLDDAAAAYRIDVASAEDLSRRLAALLETGALVAAVQPVAQPFEERVRRALEGPA